MDFKIEITATNEDMEPLLQSAVDQRVRNQEKMELTINGEVFTVAPTAYNLELPDADRATLRISGWVGRRSYQ